MVIRTFHKKTLYLQWVLLDAPLIFGASLLIIRDHNRVRTAQVRFNRGEPER